MTTPVIGGDGTIYTYGDKVGLSATAPNDGSVIWASDIKTSHAPAVSNDGTIYVSGENALYALKSSNGEEKWNLPLPTVSSPAIGGDGTVYVVKSNITSTSGLAAVNPDGKINWLFNLPTLTSDSSDIAVTDESIIFGATSGHLYAVDLSGKLIWKYDHHYQNTRYKSPIIDSEGKVVVVATTDGTYSSVLVFNKSGERYTDIVFNTAPYYTHYDTSGNR